MGCGIANKINEKKASKRQTAAIRDSSAQAAAVQREALTELRRQYDTSRGDFLPFLDMAKRAGTEYEALLDDPSRIRDLPGYQFAVEEGQDAIESSGAAQGMQLSGKTLKDLLRFGQNTATGFRTQELQNYGNLMGLGMGAGANLGQAGAAYSSGAGGQYSNLAEGLRGSGIAQAGNIAGSLAQQQASSAAGMQIGGSILSAFLSDRRAKKNMEPVDEQEILDSLYELVVEKWEYDEQVGDYNQHIGPYAQDFQEKFGIGDGHFISAIDALGVLMAANKALYSKVKNLEEKING